MSHRDYNSALRYNTSPLFLFTLMMSVISAPLIHNSDSVLCFNGGGKKKEGVGMERERGGGGAVQTVV